MALAMATAMAAAIGSRTIALWRIGSRTIALWLIGSQTMAWRPIVDSRLLKVYINIYTVIHQPYALQGHPEIPDQMLPDRLGDGNHHLAPARKGQPFPSGHKETVAGRNKRHSCLAGNPAGQDTGHPGLGMNYIYIFFPYYPLQGKISQEKFGADDRLSP